MDAGPAMLIGRTRERAAISALLDGATSGPFALVLDGVAGIGKSAIWQHAVATARSRGRLVLTAQPSDVEVSLPFAALGDIIEPILDLASGLPPTQQTAIDAALQRVDPEAPADQLAVARALLGLLRSAAEAGPALIAIDDVQWLDLPSRRALEFAIRRLRETAVRLVVARRTEGNTELPSLGLDRLAPGSVERVTVAPLSPDDVAALLRARLGLALARPRLAAIHRATGGNPFYALEYGRAILRSDVAPDDSLPIPATLGDLPRARLDSLSVAARDAVLLASASGQPVAAVIESLAGREGLVEAIREGVLMVDGDRVRFTHPLFASVAYADASAVARREAHRRLADVADDSVERAGHLGIAASGPDEGIAAGLEQAALGMLARGAPESAAGLVQRAADLTPSDRRDDAVRRLTAAAEYHLESGDPARGRRILEGLVATLEAGPRRAAVLAQLADNTEDHRGAIRLAEQGLIEAAGAPATAARLEIMLATLVFAIGDQLVALEHAGSAVRFAEEAGDELLLALALGNRCSRLMTLGLPYRAEDMARALAIEPRFSTYPAFQRPSVQLGTILLYTDRPDAARPLLQAELDRLERAGNESWQIVLLQRLAELELRSGDWAAASRLAERCLSIALSAGVGHEQSYGLVTTALVEAHLGHLDEAVDAASRALALAEDAGNRPVAIRSQGVLGFVALSRGDAPAALVTLLPATEALRRAGTGELSISHVVQNTIEALVALGRLDEAEATIAFVEEKGTPAGRSWHEAVAARGRALVAASRGDVEEARRHITHALSAHERLPQPFELGRTLLAQGRIERRAKRRADARAALTGALEIFDTLGAPRWAEQAAAELARIPGRAPASADLTETERRVAELVGQGLSNKEIAAQLFVTVRTVEANVSKVYAKLGVRSRTQLATRLR